MKMVCARHRGTRVGPAGREVLQLIAVCPRIPTDVACRLLSTRLPASTMQVLTRLRASGLVRTETVSPGPLIAERGLRLWSLTSKGEAVVAATPTIAIRNSLPYGPPERPRDPRRQLSAALQIAAFRLLVALLARIERPSRIAAWEHPWIRKTHEPTHAGSHREVRLPAAAVIVDGKEPSRLIARLLLLPDLGTAPVNGYRRVIRGVLSLRDACENDEPDPKPRLVIAVPDASPERNRVAAWHELARQIASRAGASPLDVLTLRIPDWRSPVGDHTAVSHRKTVVGGHGDQLLALVGRHPCLTPEQLALLLDTSRARIRRIIESLEERGWVQSIQEVSSGSANRQLLGRDLANLRLVELTPNGRREVARRLGLRSSHAARHHGLLGRHDLHRRHFLRNLQHTVGVNDVFVALIVAGRHVTHLGGDEAAEEWRNAAACARGRFRPDGYGCYRRGQSRYGFFLEFDRGTERAHEYAAKLAAYYRYRDSGAAKRDYTGFPTVLLVTTSDTAEDRFAREAMLASHRSRGEPLHLLLTTTRLIQSHRVGPLGPIWRAPSTTRAREGVQRGYWIPGPTPSVPSKTSWSSMSAEWSRVERPMTLIRALPKQH